MSHLNDLAMDEALDAIHDEAMKLLQLELSAEARRIAELIASLARPRYDVRVEDEQQDESD